MRYRNILIACGVTLAAPLILFNFVRFYPSRGETYDKPTLASYLIQRYAPLLYRPPIRIFTDRYGDAAGGYNGPINLVLGPDCRRFTIKDPSRVGPPGSVASDYCRLELDPAKLAQVFGNRRKNVPTSEWSYGHLSKLDMQAIRR